MYIYQEHPVRIGVLLLFVTPLCTGPSILFLAPLVRPQQLVLLQRSLIHFRDR